MLSWKAAVNILKANNYNYGHLNIIISWWICLEISQELLVCSVW